MQREQISNTVSLDLEISSPGRSAKELPRNESAETASQHRIFADAAEMHDPIQTVDAVSQSAAIGGVAKLLSSFKSAAEHQATAYLDLSERIDRLEKNEESKFARETVHGLHEVLWELASEMDRRISRAEYRIAAATKTVESLEENIASASNDLKRLNLSAQENTSTLNELLHSAEVRVGQVEMAVTELKGSDAEAFAAIEGLSENLGSFKANLSGSLNSAELRVCHIESALAELNGSDIKVTTAIDALSQNLDSLDDKLSKGKKETAQLSDRFRIAERRIASYADCEARLGALCKRVSEMREIERSLRQLQGQSDQASADICTLSGDMRVLHGSVGSVNTDYRHLNDRMEQAESGIAASLEQSRSLATLHARLAKTYSFDAD